MNQNKSFSIHNSKKSLVDRFLTARKSLVKNLEETSHRVELAAEINGVDFINDARSMDLLSTRDSFKCIVRPIIWIAVAPPHERDYALIEKYLRFKIKSVIVYGTNSDDFETKVKGLVGELKVASSLENAVEISRVISSDGDAVLFSPGCQGNNDGFLNFVERGNAFKKLVLNIQNPNLN